MSTDIRGYLRLIAEAEDAEAREDFDFVTALHDLLGMEKEEVEKTIKELDIDDIASLVDACVDEDKSRVEEIIGKTKNESDVEDQEFSDLLKRKSDFKKQKKKKQKEKTTKDADSLGIGDIVSVDGEEGTVKIPAAAGDSVGVSIDGELKMVDKKDVKVTEGVLGMTGVSGLGRIRELAGMPDFGIVGEDEAPEPEMADEAPAALDVGLDTDLGDEAPEADLGGDNALDMNAPITPTDPLDMDLDLDGATDNADLEHEDYTPHQAPLPFDEPAPPPAAMPMPTDSAPAGPSISPVAPAPSTPELPVVGGMDDDHIDMGGADLGSLGMAPAPAPTPLDGDAQALETAVSQIENLIPNVKISQFKPLVARLKALVSQAENAGRAALAESAGRGLKKITLADPVEQTKWEAGERDEVMEDDEAAVMAMIARMSGRPIAETATVKEDKFKKKDEEEIPGRKTLLDYKNEVADEAKTKAPKGASKKKISNEAVSSGSVGTSGTSGGTAAKPVVPNASATSANSTSQSGMNTGAKNQETIGRDRMSAIAAIKNRLGPKATPQDANNAFDALKLSGKIKQTGSAFAMDPMDDQDFMGALDADQNGGVKESAVEECDDDAVAKIKKNAGLK
jgi:hypothetical protein